MFFRFLFTALMIYLGYCFLKILWKKDKSRTEIKGKRESEPLDLRGSDVEDAHFEDIQEGKD